MRQTDTKTDEGTYIRISTEIASTVNVRIVPAEWLTDVTYLGNVPTTPHFVYLFVIYAVNARPVVFMSAKRFSGGDDV